ncbi:MAG: NAD(P)/FAD-dependent oxidoreductase [bacterium]
MYDVIIIGAGVAGISCALQLENEGIDYILFEKNNAGGLIEQSYRVYNNPFYSEPVSGKTVAESLRNTVRNRRFNIAFEEVNSAHYKSEFTVNTSSGRSYSSHYLVLATGSVPRRPDFDISNTHRIFFSPCDRMRSKNIAVYGGGDIALDYSLTLSEMTDSVTVITRSSVKANKTLIEAVKAKGIAVYQNREVTDIIETDGQLRVNFPDGYEQYDYMVIAIGRAPDRRLIDDIDSEELFIIGDALGRCRQTGCAFAEGIKAGMGISRSIYES